jgi:hypothetical protein
MAAAVVEVVSAAVGEVDGLPLEQAARTTTNNTAHRITPIGRRDSRRGSKGLTEPGTPA